MNLVAKDSSGDGGVCVCVCPGVSVLLHNQLGSAHVYF